MYELLSYLLMLLMVWDLSIQWRSKSKTEAFNVFEHSNKVLSFVFQSIPPLRRRPVICRIIEDEEGGPDASNMSVAEPVGQENNLDNWVTREKQVAIFALNIALN